MRSFIDFSKTRPQHPDIVLVILHPENEIEKKVLTDDTDILTIEGYYREAIRNKLPEYEFVEIIGKGQWQNGIRVKVKKEQGVRCAFTLPSRLVPWTLHFFSSVYV